jgi:O-antigen ligase
LSLVSWLFHSARAKKVTLLINWPCRFYFALAAWFLLSQLTAGDLVEGLTDFAGGMLIVSIIFILITNVPETELDLGILEKILLIAITASIMHAIMVTITQDNFEPAITRLEDLGMTGNSNDLGAIIAQALPFAVLPAIMGGKHFSRKIIALATFPILMTGLWLTQSRGAMLGVLVSVITYFVVKAKNKKRARIMMAFCVPLLLAFYSVLSLARNADDLQGSTESRRAFVIAGINMGFHNPLMGVGIGNFPKVWQSYAIGNVVETGFRTAHNTWVLCFAETGVPGLLLLIALVVATFRRGMVTKDTHPELLCALMGYSVAMSFLSHTYTFFPYVLYALIIAGAKIHATHQPKIGVVLDPEPQPA